MNLSTLDDWLDYVGGVNRDEIHLGLDRISQVAQKLGVKHPQATVITVGGTNGKGSTVKGLESIYLAAGYSVGVFTSPMLLRFNEQIRVNGQEMPDKIICEAFKKITLTQADIRLTPFEAHTLAAFCIFRQQPLDVILLEVGLGGRLDAVNCIDPDLAIVTSIALDHQAILGDTREKIGFEKAGIFRPNTPAICGDPNPPASLIEYAEKIGARFYCQGVDFDYRQENAHWFWQNQQIAYKNLPLPVLLPQNFSTVLMAVTTLQPKLPVSEKAICQGIITATLPGRLQTCTGVVSEIYDVAHNPAAIELLAIKLQKEPCSGQTHAVFSMLADKAMLESLQIIKDHIQHWYCASLNTPRTSPVEALQQTMSALAIQSVQFQPTIADAYSQALYQAEENDRIVVFGSFHTVAEVMHAKQKMP